MEHHRQNVPAKIFTDIDYLFHLISTQCSSIQKTQLITVQTFPGCFDLAGGGVDGVGSILKHRNGEIVTKKQNLV